MTITQDILSIIVGGLTIAGIALAGVKWIVRNEVREEVKDIKHETTSNGGQSMNDFIKLQIYPLLTEMRSDQLDIKNSIGMLEGWREEHVRDHA